MFGSTSGWGQNNQQQQQPQQQGGGLFGGGGGFGQPQQQQQQNTGFGGGFGQQQQQPAAGGGLFGGNTGQTSTFGSGGGFGATNAQPTSTFGANRPTFGATGTSSFGGQQNTGGGLFGNTSSTFGGANNQQSSGGLFGAKPATTSTFGSGATSGLFGAKPATSSPFGGGATGAQAQNPNAVVPYFGDRAAPPPPGTGTAEPAYHPTWQQDPSSGTSTSSSMPPHLFHAISAMEPYRGASPDELRAMDYQQNRKNATPQQPATGGFGAQTTGGFGQPAQTSTFGQQPATSTFGAKPAGGGLFGSTPAANTGFGQSSGGFGQTSNTGGGLFGQPAQQPASTGFGQSNTGGGGLFGQAPAAQPAAGGGLFGNTSSGFGAQQNQQQQPATNTFGSFGQAKPATTGFGSTPGGGFGASTSTFGQQPAANTGSTFGGFGQTQQNQQQQQPAAGGGLFGGGGFGQNNQQQPAQNTGGGLFGQTNQQQNQPASGGLFGNNASKPGGLFGAANTGTGTGTGAGTTGGFSFGQNNTQQPASTGGLFGGANNNQTNNTGGGLFGQNNQQQNTQQQPAAGGGLFGNTAGGGGLFGAKPAATGTTGGLFGSAPQNQQQPAQPGSLFGNTGTTGGGGLFGSQNNQANQQQNNQAKPGGLFGGGGGGLFGGGQTQQPQQTANSTGGGLFGNLGQSQPAQSSLFGQPQQQTQQPSMGGSLFGGGGMGLGQSTGGQQQQQPNLNASIDQNPYGRSELFNYSGQKLEFGSQNKKPALPPLTASSYRITPSKSQINKLRGFASPLASSQSPGGRASTPLSSSGRGGFNSPSSDRYKGLTDAALTPNAFVPRPSIKRLNVTPKSNGVAGSDDHLESVLGKSALKSSTSKSTPTQNGLSSSSGALTFNPPVAKLATGRDSDTPSRRAATPLESSRPLAVAGSERQPSHGQYWCKPRMEKLRQMGEGYLSKISNFTVGRSGYGEVTFLEPVDVTGFDLNDLFGKVVVFTEMELAVYPDDWEDKPPQGKGLNHPARITLLNCFPRDKANKQPITDMSDPRHARFLKRVKNIPDTEFVSYTDDGSWTFEVKHFSKYGLRDGSDDDDEGESEDDGNMAARRRLKEREAFRRPTDPASRTPSRTPESDASEDDFMPPTKSLHDVDHDSGFDEDEVLSQDQEESESRRSSTASADDETETETADGSLPPGYDTEMEIRRDEHINHRLGHEGMMKLREMKSSMFGFDSAQPPLQEKRGLGAGVKTAQIGGKRTLQDRLAGFGEAGEDLGALDNRAVKRPSFGIKPSPPMLRRPREFAQVALADSIANDKEGVEADAGLSLGRSFRCSWGPNGELVHLGKICAPSSEHTPSTTAQVTVEPVYLLSEEAKTESTRAERLLRLHIEHSSIDTIDGIPQATISPSIRFHHFSSLFEPGDRSHEANVFRLGQALFDEINLRLPLDSPEELADRILSIRRKLALSKWLENAVAPSVDSDLLKNGENRPAKLFTLLSGNLVARAVDMALEGNDMRLASLISQIGRTGEFREEVLSQLEDWAKFQADSVISVEYRRVYALIAGITDISPGNKARGTDFSPDVIVSKDLDWKRAFGLRLWYACPLESTISEVFAEYDESLNHPHPPATPLPPYLEFTKSSKWSLPTRPTDVLYDLIRLYSDAAVSLEQVLSARDSSSSPTDLRLPWHLYLLLSRVLQKRDFLDRDEEGYSAQADRLTQAYAAQLEQTGQWTFAAFVLLHLETVEGREQSIRALLHRHPEATPEDTAFLVDRLCIPAEWLHESRAASLASSGSVYQEYHALIDAKLYNRAHRILLDKLAPEAILRDDLDLLRRMCEPINGKPDGWAFGAKLLLEYIDIKTEVPTLLRDILSAGAVPDPIQQGRLIQLANDIPRLLRLLPALFPRQRDVQQVACLSDMLSALHHLAGQLSLANYMTRPSVSDSLVDVDRLHLLQSSAYDAFNTRLESLAQAA